MNLVVLLKPAVRCDVPLLVGQSKSPLPSNRSLLTPTHTIWPRSRRRCP